MLLLLYITYAYVQLVLGFQTTTAWYLRLLGLSTGGAANSVESEP